MYQVLLPCGSRLWQLAFRGEKLRTNPKKRNGDDDLGVPPLFSETSIYIYTHKLDDDDDDDDDEDGNDDDDDEDDG